MVPINLQRILFFGLLGRAKDIGPHNDLVEVLHLALVFTMETLSKVDNEASCSTAEATSTPSCEAKLLRVRHPRLDKLPFLSWEVLTLGCAKDIGPHNDLVEVLHLALVFLMETLSKIDNEASCSTAEATSTPSCEAKLLSVRHPRLDKLPFLCWEVLTLGRAKDIGPHNDLVEVLHLALVFTMETLSKVDNEASCSTAEATSTPSCEASDEA
ncbi:hypothetical protein RHMOL_Rhmol10G0201600 [Rhododendron molle]|uniref:Uncharacterized protein n=1 Tax=Rhododendron molle TaxID=49168 RepID=A0ACC0M5V6_RHOML|nr:hypothetical protein RHMOL_Rhmol10G0201600 [Rhododendron molle]